MDTTAAKELVRKTLQQSFDKNRFVNLIRNILNHIEEAPLTYQGNYIFADFADSIRLVERIGKYKDPDEKLMDILIVHLKKDTSLERARTRQRNYVAKYLKSRGGVLKDAALVAFVAPNGDWRFSLVKMEYKFSEQGKVKEEFTPARRYSFLVGENENSHTAQSRLLPILLDDEANPTLEELEQAFSVERVTREFFEKYRDLFLRLKDSLDAIVEQDANIKNDLKTKNVETSDFTKKLLGQIVFLYFLQKKGWFGVKRGEVWGAGSKHFLRELFDKEHGDYKNFFNDILEPLFYEALRYDRRADDDYFSQFKCKIPFLNGGLFDPINDYDWINTDIPLPDDIFVNGRTTKEGDIGDGVLDIFDRYNFTVKEDEPLEKEVAVDPEMLGKVFENLLEVKDRKSKGAYYTPREIVHYMCQESLINYLMTELDGKASKEDIETLIKYGESVVEHDSRVVSKGRETKTYAFKLPESIRKHAKPADESMASIRVCDPAVGSGAFVVGMMNEIVRARNVLTPYIGKNGERSPYHFKREAIQNCLYGVDIDASAVEIAKLRLWLSLVVDEEERETVQPLPNLDYKIVQGNSLLGVEKDIFNEQLFKELERLKLLYFNEISTVTKQKYKEEIDELIEKITSEHKGFDFEVYFSEVFHEKKGFDVVIANPPYISHDKIKEKETLKKFKAYQSFADIYCYFFEVSLNIQSKTGLLCFITSNSYLKAEYGHPLRNFLIEKNHILTLVNIEDFQVFEAIVNNAVLISQRRDNRIPSKCLVVNSHYDATVSFQIFIDNNRFYYNQSDFDDKAWYLIRPDFLSIKRKSEHFGKALSTYKPKIKLGIATGANKSFVIDESLKNQLLKTDPHNSKIIKPILRGRDIFRYKYKLSAKYIILAANGINVKKDYPAVYSYLNSFGSSFKNRGAKGKHWSNLRPMAFLEDFKQEKIIWIELTDKGRFALCSDEVYLLNSAYFLIPPKQFSAKYLLGILNSSVIEFYLHIVAETSGMGVTRWINNYVKDFPIPEVSSTKQKLIIDIVNKILATTKYDDYLQNTAKQAKVRDYEKQIDKLVYQLYDLTDKEIKIIESAL